MRLTWDRFPSFVPACSVNTATPFMPVCVAWRQWRGRRDLYLLYPCLPLCSTSSSCLPALQSYSLHYHLPVPSAFWTCNKTCWGEQWDFWAWHAGWDRTIRIAVPQARGGGRYWRGRRKGGRGQAWRDWACRRMNDAVVYSVVCLYRRTIPFSFVIYHTPAACLQRIHTYGAGGCSRLSPPPAFPIFHLLQPTFPLSLPPVPSTKFVLQTERRRGVTAWPLFSSQPYLPAAHACARAARWLTWRFCLCTRAITPRVLHILCLVSFMLSATFVLFL